MLLKRKTLCSQIMKTIPKILWNALCFVIIVTTIGLLLKYTCEASSLRNWKNESNEYIGLTNFNLSISQRFLKFLYSNSSDTIIDTESDDYEETTSSSSEEEAEEADTKCKPEPPRDDFSKCGNRVADRKCCEYIWAWKYKDELLERSDCLLDGFGIVGGSQVKPGEFPHMVALGFKRLKKNNTSNSAPSYGYMCGGTLISEQFVLTAGHCTSLGNSKEFELKPSVVGMGSETLSQNMKKFKIEKIIPHEKYASPKRYYDIALIKLQEKVQFTYTIHPACLSTELVPQYMIVNVTGWGTTNPKDITRMSDHLLVATLNIIHHDECQRKVVINRNFPRLRLHQLCAGDYNRSADTCKGDSGGPVQVRINTPYGNIHRVIAVTSFGFRCATKVPSVYVRVSSVVTWIERNVWPEYNNNYTEGLGYR